ncbi:MAG TPA: hypothetical protein VFC44_03565 [Candidatus Saccharimonadales bacterium]|nr:hypothetical protein [Candidatus Saccharimonadales bacterium]
MATSQTVLTSMVLKHRTVGISTAVGIIMLLAAIGLLIAHEFSDTKNGFSRTLRLLKGEPILEQKASDLADELRHSPVLPQLQSWTVATMHRFRDGRVQTNGGNTLPWENDAVMLAPSEMPLFIKKYLAYTNRLGDILPELSIVLTNKQPSYIALNFGNWGIVVGDSNYRVCFDPEWTNNVAPGIYTFGIQWESHR